MTNFSQIYDLVTVTIFPGSLESLQGQKIKATQEKVKEGKGLL